MIELAFVFFLTVYPEEGEAIWYVEDYGMSATDCTDAMVHYHETDPTWSRGVPSCEIDKQETHTQNNTQGEF